MRVLVVDDDPLGNRLVQFLLAEQGYSVETAGDPRAVLDLVEQSPPDLLLLDVNLPQMSGFDLYQRLRGRGYDLPVIFVTAKDDVDARVLGLKLGADDYVCKPFQPAELTARVAAVLRRYRKATTGPLGLSAGGLEIDASTLQVKLPDGRVVTLTPTENKVLLQLARQVGEAVDREDILRSVWGEMYEGEHNIVDVYIRRLRRKLESDPAHPQRIQSARGVGYMLRG